ncbi:MAG TPA: DUF6538 domain-containing protein [Flavipsychrobacter sp.]
MYYATQGGLMEESHIVKRGEWYHYRRRVPEAVAYLDERKEVTISLKTKNKSEALIRAGIYNTHIENFWKALITSDTTSDIDKKYKAAVILAKAHGFAYKTTEQIATTTLNELVERLRVDFKTQKHTEAVLGAVEQPQILLSECIEKYWECSADRLRDKSESKIRKWKNPRRLAMEDFIQVVGDKSLQQVSREDVLKFRTWWLESIKEHKVSGDTGNKKLMHIKDIIATVSNQHNIDVDTAVLFANTRFEHAKQSRPPFDAKYVQNKLLPSISNMKEVYQMIIMVMADTGAREAEIFGLAAQDIYLDAPVPYIHIRSRKGYQLKTATSERKIPLVGTALYAFKKYPAGFNHAGNPDTFSTSVNKFLTENNLKPTPRHSVYSLRHTFKDRLRDIGAPEELIDSLMGHKKAGPQYGRGHKLETAHEWLRKIAYSAP